MGVCYQRRRDWQSLCFERYNALVQLQTTDLFGCIDRQVLCSTPKVGNGVACRLDVSRLQDNDLKNKTRVALARKERV